jgi:hypothetical protein
MPLKVPTVADMVFDPEPAQRGAVVGKLSWLAYPANARTAWIGVSTSRVRSYVSLAADWRYIMVSNPCSDGCRAARKWVLRHLPCNVRRGASPAIALT